MKIYPIISALNFLAGAVVSGDALIELAYRRSHLIPADKWIKRKKRLIVTTDIIWGIAIILLAVSGLPYYSYAVYHWIVVMLLVSHAYREWEVWQHIQGVFCVDCAMRARNRIKLVLLFIAEIITIVSILS